MADRNRASCVTIALMPNLPAPLKTLLSSEDALFAVGGSWLVGVPALTAVGFYAGTIFGSKHIVDLRPADIQNGGVGALAGLAVGVVVALLVTVIYPKKSIEG